MSARRDAAAATPRPASVGAVVRSVCSSLRATRRVEGLLFLAAGALAVRCAALLSGPTVEDGAELAGLCVLAGLLCGVAWLREHPVEEPVVARALDERLRFHGALATAWDVERRRRAGCTPMEELVRARVLERLRAPDALRVLFPPLFVPIAAPTLAGLGLVLLLDARRAPEASGADFRALAAGLEQALAMGGLDAQSTGLVPEDPDGSLTRAQVEDLTAALHVRAQLPYRDEDWTTDPERVRERLAEADRRLAELGARAEPGSELHRRLEEGRTWLDAMRMGLAAAPAEGGSEEGNGSGAPGGTTDGADGTISRPPDRPEPPPMTSTTSPGAAAGVPLPALGLQSSGWWPSEYDALVERWVERTRAEHPTR